jgi:hypothetical protein
MGVQGGKKVPAVPQISVWEQASANLLYALAAALLVHYGIRSAAALARRLAKALVKELAVAVVAEMQAAGERAATAAGGSGSQPAAGTARDAIRRFWHDRR